MEFSNGINSIGCKFALLMPTRNPVYTIVYGNEFYPICDRHNESLVCRTVFNQI